MDVQSPKVLSAHLCLVQGYLPRLINVPHFEGILRGIHSGNDATTHAGCIPRGPQNKVEGAKVLNSMETRSRDW